MRRMSLRSTNRLVGLTLLAFSCWSLAGCDARHRTTVEGNVTLGGEPLDAAEITFRPQASTPGPEFSGRVTAGHYRVEKAVLPGVYWVDVRAWKKTGQKVRSPFGEEVDEIVVATPARYWGATTELKAELQQGPNTLNFDLLK